MNYDENAKHAAITGGVVVGALTIASVAFLVYNAPAEEELRADVHQAAQSQGQLDYDCGRDTSCAITAPDDTTLTVEMNPSLDVGFKKPKISKKLLTLRGAAGSVFGRATVRDVLVDIGADGVDCKDYLFTRTRKGTSIDGELIHSSEAKSICDFGTDTINRVRTTYNRTIDVVHDEYKL
ncbi:hypothetical protein HOK51_04545 [Candidatus Woesearchaeota archaeon]|jgi:hypothetical protein|nr:hypothetical protein [Candidatus Woesearchaeota archaeon]MBT6519093.1 hypothetical protein [Candidatus Woesearchaeota archaeon]MBT7367036.1 hypothetical protein [Candidatus Woesearchaeota archaeon]